MARVVCFPVRVVDARVDMAVIIQALGVSTRPFNTNSLLGHQTSTMDAEMVNNDQTFTLSPTHAFSRPFNSQPCLAAYLPSVASNILVVSLNRMPTLLSDNWKPNPYLLE